MTELALIAFIAPTTNPKEACMTIDVVAKLAIASVATTIEQMATYRGGTHGAIDDVLSYIDVRIGHHSGLVSGVFSKGMIHREENLGS